MNGSLFLEKFQVYIDNDIFISVSLCDNHHCIITFYALLDPFPFAALSYETDYVVWCAVQNFAQPFHRKKCNIAILFQKIQSLVVDSGLQEFVLCNLFFFHRFP